MEPEQDLQESRARYFGRCAAMMYRALQEHPGDPRAPVESLDLTAAEPGHEGLFDQALSNGLAAIVATHWPGEEARPNGHVYFARDLLKVIAGRAAEDGSPGVHLIEDPAPVEPLPPGPAGTIFDVPRIVPEPVITRVDVALLTEAIDLSGNARHGRGNGGLQRCHIEALLALDDHPALGTLTEEITDQDGTRAREESRLSVAQAQSLLELIGGDEAGRRAEAAVNPNGYDPKTNPEGIEARDCPVCGFETFFGLGYDIWGWVAYGQCAVCSYQRSQRMADEEGARRQIEHLLNEDD
ncbi:hypothetical protein OG900_38805 [Streptomyces sp. NBC_00433]